MDICGRCVAGFVCVGVFMKNLATFLFFVFLLALTNSVFACPVCFDAKGGTAIAFRYSTLFLSLVPVVFIASTLYWIYQKNKKMDS